MTLSLLCTWAVLTWGGAAPSVDRPTTSIPVGWVTCTGPVILNAPSLSHVVVWYDVASPEWHAPQVIYLGPLDLDGDQRLTSADWFAATNLFLSGLPFDYDRSGVTNSQDWFTFSNEWRVWAEKCH